MHEVMPWDEGALDAREIDIDLGFLKEASFFRLFRGKLRSTDDKKDMGLGLACSLGPVLVSEISVCLL